VWLETCSGCSIAMLTANYFWLPKKKVNKLYRRDTCTSEYGKRWKKSIGTWEPTILAKIMWTPNCSNANNGNINIVTLFHAGLKIYFTEPSDKMSDDVEFGSDVCPMTFVQF
jgi:hypothetical protein